MSIKIHRRPASITVREFHWPTVEAGRRTQQERPHVGSKSSLAAGACGEDQRAPKEQFESDLRRRCEEAYQRGAEEARTELQAERDAEVPADARQTHAESAEHHCLSFARPSTSRIGNRTPGHRDCTPGDPSRAHARSRLDSRIGESGPPEVAVTRDSTSTPCTKRRKA